LAAGLGEREIAEFVEDDDVEASEMVGDASLASGSTFGLELIDEIDGVKKRPRDPARMQLRAMAMARCVLPVPVPPTRMTLRCWAMKPPPVTSTA
jgi:hypothetical protein